MPFRLINFDPSHFHAALLQKEMYPELHPRAVVYAPLGTELLDYLHRISLFNSRADNPTSWELDVHCAPDPLEEMLRRRNGNVVVFTGRNRAKINRIAKSIRAGLNVLADKPWIIRSSDLPLLEETLRQAAQQKLIAYDIMTERFEVTSELGRELVNSPEIFGQLEKGSAEHPAIQARSVHYIMKIVSGMPLRRPAWFFDTSESGEGLADVGTHVIDLVQWTAFADQAIDYRKDIQLVEAHRWPLTLTREQFNAVTGETNFPAALAPSVQGGKLDYYCNNAVHYTLRGVHARLEISWDWKASEGSGDVYEAAFQGSKARIEIRQQSAQNYRPELYVVPGSPALQSKVRDLQSRWPGLSVEENATEAHLQIPEQFRVGHEAHFHQVAQSFFQYLRSPDLLPEWEAPNMLAKYYVATKGVELSLRNDL